LDQVGSGGAWLGKFGKRRFGGASLFIFATNSPFITLPRRKPTLFDIDRVGARLMFGVQTLCLQLALLTCCNVPCSLRDALIFSRWRLRTSKAGID
jgi:hypothetical protein